MEIAQNLSVEEYLGVLMSKSFVKIPFSITLAKSPVEFTQEKVIITTPHYLAAVYMST